VFHEAKRIKALVESIHQLEGLYHIECIVVDGSPSQDTLAVLTDTTVVRINCRQGRGFQMNIGAAHAQGEILMFVHADTMLPKNTLQLIEQTLKSGDYVGGAFSLHIQSRHPLLRIIAFLSTLRSHLTRAPYGDQVIFIKKQYFDFVGGYRDIPLMEDVELMRRIYKNGGKIRILPQTVLTSSRRWNAEGILYTTVRDLVIITLYWLGVPAQKIARFYPWLNEEEHK